VVQLAIAASTFVANSHAQGLLPATPGQINPDDLVRAELVASVDAIAPGSAFQLAVRLAIKDAWHVNWLNPGDAGLAPGVAWKVPKGYKTTVMCWPYPERFTAGSLVIFGYAKELILVTEVTPPNDLVAGGRVDLAADVSWLACEEACIPGSAQLKLSLPIEPKARGSASAPAIAAWVARCPSRAGAWTIDASFGDRETLLLDLQTAEPGGARMNDAFFYSYEPGVIENSAPQMLSALDGPNGQIAYQLRTELWGMATTLPERLRGVLVMERDGTRAIEIDVPIRRR
jgi:thiol:disulfide interchange protein DsbD